MSDRTLTGRLRSLRQRPFAERERPRVLAVAIVLLLAGTLILLFTRPHDPVDRQREIVTAGRVRSPTTPRALGSERPAQNSRSQSIAMAARTVALRFLSGYLPYIYGHAPARAITGATAGVERSLIARPPLVPEGIRARRPRVLALHTELAPTGQVEVSALVNDGETASYPVDLVLVREAGRLLVGAIGPER